MLRMIGYGDNAGSGFPTILDAWRGEKWREPDLYEDAELQQVNLKLFTIALMPEECSAYLSRLLGKKTYQNMSSEAQIILGTAYLEGSVSNQRMQQIFDLHPTDIGKILGTLVEKGVLISAPKGRWTTYTINKGYKASLEQLDFSDIVENKIVFKNKSDRIIYDYICANHLITTRQVMAITKISTPQGASVALNRLIDKGLIKKQGNGRSTCYVLVNR